MPKYIFYFVFIFAFFIGWVVRISGVIPYQMAYLSLFPMLLIVRYGIRLEAIKIPLFLLAGEIIVSAILNDSSFRDLALFMRYLFITYSMYYIVDVYLNPKNIKNVLKLSLAIGIIQLPVVLIQAIFFKEGIEYSLGKIHPIDVRFGTFYTSNDMAMSFFLMGLILFLLFDNRNNYFVKYRLMLSIWLTLTVLISNSFLSIILVVLIWLHYFIKDYDVKKIFALWAIAIFCINITVFADFSFVYDKIEKIVSLLDFSEFGSKDVFFEGGYSRKAAVLYYLSEPLNVFGDGPSKYYDPVTREYILGNKGQLFTFYSEIGIVGLLLGYFLLFILAWKKKGTSRAIAAPYFLLAITLTTTTSVMTDASIMLAYSLFLSTNLVSNKSDVIKEIPIKNKATEEAATIS